MTLQIEIFKSTGNPETSEIITNNNFKSSGLANSQSAYWTVPVRRPEDPELLTYSFTNIIYGKFSGTWSQFRRPRWVIDIPNLITESNVPPQDEVEYDTNDEALFTGSTKLFLGRRDIYVPPTNDIDGTLQYHNNKSLVLYPNTSTGGPGSATSHNQFWNGNTTGYTDYLYMQLVVERSALNNIEPIKITFQVDLYE